MTIQLKDYQKKKLIGYKIINNNDFSNILIGTNMYFYNLNNKYLSYGKFKKIHSDLFIICNNRYNKERVFQIDKYIIFYKPKVSKERLLMEDLYNNLKIVKEL